MFELVFSEDIEVVLEICGSEASLRDRILNRLGMFLPQQGQVDLGANIVPFLNEGLADDSRPPLIEGLKRPTVQNLQFGLPTIEGDPI